MTDNFIRNFLSTLYCGCELSFSYIIGFAKNCNMFFRVVQQPHVLLFLYETFNGKGNSNAANFLSRFLHIGCYVPNLGHNFLQGKLSDSQWFHFFIRQFASHLLFICEFLSRNLLLPVVYIAKVFHRHPHIYMDARKDTFTHIDTNAAYNDKYKTQATIS